MKNFSLLAIFHIIGTYCSGQPEIESELGLQTALSRIIKQTGVATAFFKTGSCPDLAEPTIARRTIAFKMVHRCDEKAVSIFSNVLTLDLESGVITIGVDSSARVASTLGESKRCRSAIRNLRLPVQIRDSIISDMNTGVASSCNYKLAELPQSGLFVKLIKLDKSGTYMETVYLHALSGKVFAADLYTIVYQQSNQLLKDWHEKMFLSK